jgi:diguanylate cyclase (GGDEF)-like protein
LTGGVNRNDSHARPGRSPFAWAMFWAKAPTLPRIGDAGGDPAGAPRARARARLSAARLIVMLAVIAMGVTMVCAGIGYTLAHRSDERRGVEQRQALRGAIAEFRALFGDSDTVDPRLIHLIEQSAGLKGLKFETEPGASTRELQPVIDAQGRIVGFFTFTADRPMTQAMDRLMPALAVMVVLLVGFAGQSLWQLLRARRELAMSEAQARRAADEDKLTGLPNHSKVLELLDLALAERAGDEITSFALIELDGMADINAQLGVLGSDELTVSVAKRLKEVLPAGAVFGRIGADQFAVTFTAGPDVDATAVLRAAIDAVSRPHWIDTVVRVGARAGLAQAPLHAATRGELTHRAELALRKSAQKGPASIVTYAREIDAASSDQQFIRRELPRALSAHELELHYQPIVAAQGARIVGVEALLRWTHATRGPIGPAVFIPVAEQMGLMDTLGAFVLRRALIEAKRWPDLYMAVNLSPLQVRDRGIVDLVRATLAETGVEPSRLMLEITEGVLIDNPEEMVRRIEELHALGVRIALDDFGSGYSNLGYLQRFPFDKLKIDKSFVSALGHSANGGVIIQAIVALGRALGVAVLVEGVETEEQRVLLRLAGCDEMQGFLFARPAPAKVIDRLLAQPKSARALPQPGDKLTA